MQNIIENYNVLREIFLNDTKNNLFINKYVNKIYIINLKEFEVRKKYIITLMKKYKINFELIIVSRISEEEYNIIKNIKINIGEFGCLISHLYCLNDAIKEKYKNFIIFEDDIIFHKNFHELFETICSKQKYDLLMLGAADFSFEKVNYKLTDNINKIYKPDPNTKQLYGSHAILYSYDAALLLFENKINNITFYDDDLMIYFNKLNNSGICYPNLVVQELSTTGLDHNFSIMYNKGKEKNYYQRCFNNIFNFHDYNFIYLDFFSKKYIFKYDLTYEKNINNLLELYYKEQKEIINKRLVYDFFTVDDLLFISY